MNAFSLLKPQLTASFLAEMIYERFEMDELVHFVSIAPSDFAGTIADDGKLPIFNRDLLEEVLLNLDAIGVVELAVHAADDGNRSAHFTWHGVVRDPLGELAVRCNTTFTSGAWPRASKKRGTRKLTVLTQWPRLDFNWEDWLFGFFQESAGYYGEPLSKADIKKGLWLRSSIPDDLAGYVRQVLIERSVDELILAGGRGERIREIVLRTYC